MYLCNKRKSTPTRDFYTLKKPIDRQDKQATFDRQSIAIYQVQSAQKQHRGKSALFDPVVRQIVLLAQEVDKCLYACDVKILSE